ncbi:hypothetical protein [Persephonella sp.]
MKKFEVYGKAQVVDIFSGEVSYINVFEVVDASSSEEAKNKVLNRKMRSFASVDFVVELKEQNR